MENLINIQSELKAPKGNVNKFGNYKYRSAEDILEALKPLLKKHNSTLILTDEIVLIGEKYFLKAIANFSSNEKTVITNGYAELSEHKGMSAEQATGTASSYARKYALNGLFLIDETEQDADSQKPIEQPSINPIWVKEINSCTSIEMLEIFYKTNEVEIKKQKDIIELIKSQKLKLQNGN